MEKKSTNEAVAYIKIRLRHSTAEKFRSFSRQLAPNHSAAMDLMLDFFEKNGISPREKLGPKMTTLEQVLKKRIDYLVSVVKNIEKTEIKPVQAMMELLFQENPAVRKAVLKEKRPRDQRKNSASPADLQLQNRILQHRLWEQQQGIDAILRQTRKKKTGFGKTYLRLEMSPEQFEELRSKLTDSHGRAD